MESASNQTSRPREPWNKGKLVGQKAPFKLKVVGAIRVWLQLEHRTRELGAFLALVLACAPTMAATTLDARMDAVVRLFEKHPCEKLDDENHAVVCGWPTAATFIGRTYRVLKSAQLIHQSRY